MSRLRIPALVTLLLSLALFPGRRASTLNPVHDCTGCHGLHGSTGAQLTKASDIETLCLTCHGPSGTATRADVHRNDTGGSAVTYQFRFTCIDCHVPHDNVTNRLFGSTDPTYAGATGVNIKLVRGTLLDRLGGSKEVVFESRGTDAGGVALYSFCDNDADGDGIRDAVCDVCHLATELTKHELNQWNSHNHWPGRTCTTCHYHWGSFINGGNPDVTPP